MSVENIFNYLEVDDRVSTAGQPTEEQLSTLAAEGFTAVINLVPTNPLYAPADEAGLVAAQGLDYTYVPVDWNNPTDADFAAFEAAFTRLRNTANSRVLIHCAANFRVTAFYSLYAQRHLGWSTAEAGAFRARIWAGSDYPIWEQFIARKQAEMQGKETS